MQKLSRSKIELFLECPRCFWLEVKKGVKRPPGFPFTLNNAVDYLLKQEFDHHRKQKTPHPLMEAYGVEAVPFDHEDIDVWRDALRRGVEYFYQPINLIVAGGLDDVWVNKEGELIVVDYKATSKDSAINLDAEWQDGYKRQLEVYQWLLRQNNFKVSDTGYFVYANGKRDREAFDGRLEFDVVLIPYTGSDKWIPQTLQDMKDCLHSDSIPNSSYKCEYCKYNENIQRKGV